MSRVRSDNWLNSFATLLLLALAALGWPHTARADAVLDWNAHAGFAATKACIAPLDDPFHESRIYAMMHTALSTML